MISYIMLYCILRHCVIIYSILRNYNYNIILLYCSTSYSIVLLYCTKLYYIVLYFIILYCFIIGLCMYMHTSLSKTRHDIPLTPKLDESLVRKETQH